MAHIFDVMTALCGHLNVLSKHYFDNASVRTINPPPFLVLSISRAIDTKSSKDIFVDSKQGDPVIDIASIVDTGDNFNPLYVCVADNLKNSIVDRVPVIINYKDISGPGVGIIVIVPRALFGNATSVEQSARYLKDIYFKLLEFDPIMQYKPDATMLRYSENKNSPIPTYDLTMAYAALGCANINLRNWFTINDKQPLPAEYLLKGFDKGELDENTIKNIAYTLNKNAERVGNLRDSVANGDLLLYALYDVEEE